MKKKEWMIILLAILMILIFLVSALILAMALKNKDVDSTRVKSKNLEEIIEVEEVYEPIEEDIMVTIEKSFRERYNVIEIMDAHVALEPEIEGLIDKGIRGKTLKNNIKDSVESYIEGQTRQIAREVLMEYVENYNSWELDYLVRKANNSEKIEVLYLFEIQSLKSKGILSE